MNEIQLLRNQLATERRHVHEVASACAVAHRTAPAPPDSATLEALRGECTEYLGCVLNWFDRRDEHLAELYDRLPAGAVDRRARAALSLRGRGREALEKLQGRPPHEGWQALTEFIDGPWDVRRGAIEMLLVSGTPVAAWRAFAAIDADSVYQERALYARVRTALPAGIELAAGRA